MISDKSFKLFYRRIIFPIDLDSKRLDDLKNKGLGWFNDVLHRPVESRTELETRILNAAIWIGNSPVERTERGRFLKLCIALESLFITREEFPYGATIGDRLAFLLGKKPADRIEISHIVRKIYEIRSRVAHEGKPKHEGDLVKYMPYVFAYSNAAIYAILNLVKNNNWKTFDEVRKHFEELKFS